MTAQPAASRPSIAAVAALDDDVRRALYEHVRDARRPITREEAAAATGISRKLAAFHLDKLVAVGLLRAEYDAACVPRRVGRVPKVYRPTDTDIEVCIPARKHAVLAEILLGAVLAARSGEPADEAALRVADAEGRRLGAAERERLRPGRLGAQRALSLASAVTERYGFEPAREQPGVVRLRNCPFHPLAQREPELVCAVNHAFLSGMLAGMQARGVDAVLDPRPNECCVALREAR